MIEIELKEPDTNALYAMSNVQKKTIEAHRDQDLIAKWMIQSYIEESIFPWISRATIAHQAWNLLASAYKGTNRVKMVRLQTL